MLGLGSKHQLKFRYNSSKFSSPLKTVSHLDIPLKEASSTEIETIKVFQEEKQNQMFYKKIDRDTKY